MSRGTFLAAGAFLWLVMAVPSAGVADDTGEISLNEVRAQVSALALQCGSALDRAIRLGVVADSSSLLILMNLDESNAAQASLAAAQDKLHLASLALQNANCNFGGDPTNCKQLDADYRAARDAVISLEVPADPFAHEGLDLGGRHAGDAACFDLPILQNRLRHIGPSRVHEFVIWEQSLY